MHKQAIRKVSAVGIIKCHCTCHHQWRWCAGEISTWAV